MTYPPAITLRPCTLGGSTALESGTQLALSAEITASRSLKWGATGWQFPSLTRTVTGAEGAELSFSLPVTDLAGWRLNDDSGSIIDVSTPGSHTHTYTIKLSTLAAGRRIAERTIGPFVLPTGDGSVLDLDLTIPAPTLAGMVVMLPDLTPRVAALEAALGGASAGLITADDTPAAPAEGESASYFVTSAVVWPAGLEWSTDPDGGTAPTITGTALVSMFTVDGATRAIMGATFPALPVPADTTAPTVPTGLTATPASSTSVSLSWTASTDAVGVTGYEYRVGGGTAVDAGAGVSETVAGLTASTPYSFEVRAYDAAGNRSAWSTAASATTSAPPADATPPTVGTMAASSITTSGFTLTVSGASDETALHATPYAFTTDGGTTWSSYQSSAVYVASGLTASTGYSCNWRVRDAAGNVSTGTAQTVTTGAALPGLAETILALNPVGYWKLDEASGTQATDYSGNGRHGTYSGDFTLTAGQFATLGTTGRVTIPDHDDFTAAGSTAGFSVFGLACRTSTGAIQGALVSKHNASTTEWSVELDKDNKVLSYVMAGSTYLFAELSSTAKVALSSWHGVAATMPMPVAGSKSTNYVDGGAADAASSIASGTPTLVNTTQPVTIGMRGDASRSFIGKLGHVAIFRKELTTSEVASLMAAASAEGLI